MRPIYPLPACSISTKTSAPSSNTSGDEASTSQPLRLAGTYKALAVQHDSDKTSTIQKLTQFFEDQGSTNGTDGEKYAASLRPAILIPKSSLSSVQPKPVSSCYRPVKPVSASRPVRAMVEEIQGREQGGTGEQEGQHTMSKYVA